jgi:hypothetical protein
MLEALAELNDLSIADMRQRFLWALSMVYSRNSLLPVVADAATDASNPSNRSSQSASSSSSSSSQPSEMDGGEANDDEAAAPMSRRRRLTAKQRRAAAAASAAVSSYRDRVSAHESRQMDDMEDANAPQTNDSDPSSSSSTDPPPSSGRLNLGSLSPASSSPLFGANAAARGADAERFELSMVPLLDMVNHADPGMTRDG